MVTVEDKPGSYQSGEEGGQIIEEDNQDGNNVKDEKSEGELLNEQTHENDLRKKRLCFKIDKLFTTLFEDLNLLCEWENDEKRRGSNDKS